MNNDNTLTITENKVLIVSIPVFSENRRPRLSGDTHLNVSLGVPSTYIVTAVDPDGDPLTVWLDGSVPEGTFDNDTLVFTWTPTSLEPFVLKYVWQLIW